MTKPYFGPKVTPIASRSSERTETKSAPCLCCPERTARSSVSRQQKRPVVPTQTHSTRPGSRWPEAVREFNDGWPSSRPGPCAKRLPSAFGAWRSSPGQGRARAVADGVARGSVFLMVLMASGRAPKLPELFQQFRVWLIKWPPVNTWQFALNAVFVPVMRIHHKEALVQKIREVPP